MTDNQVTVPFSGGPDDQTDPRLLPPGSVISATNQIYDQDGAYIPRFGYSSLPNGPTKSFKLGVFGNELLDVDGQNLWTWNNQGAAWVNKDPVNPVGVTHRTVWSATTSFESWGEAYGSGYRVLAWVDKLDNQVRAAIYDGTTNACVLGPQLLAPTVGGDACARVNVGIVGTIAIVVALSGSSNKVTGWNINLSPLSGFWSGANNLGAGGTWGTQGTRAQFGFCTMSSTLAICYEWIGAGGESGNNYIVVRSFNTSFAMQVETRYQFSTSAGIYRINAFAMRGTTGENLWIAWYNGQTGSTALGYDLGQWDPSTLVHGFGDFALGSNLDVPPGAPLVLERVSSTQVLYVATGSGSKNFHYTIFGQFTTAGAVGSGAMYMYGAVPASAPVFIPSLGTALMFMRNPYSWPTTAPSQSYYLVDMVTSKTDASTIPRVLAILAPRLVFGPQTIATVAPNIVQTSTGVYETVLPILRSNGRQAFDVFKLDTGANFRWSQCSLGKERYLSGQYYDGNRVCETGFPYNPPLCSPAGQAGAGSFTGTWNYCYTYGRVNAAGNLEESAPSPAASVAVASKAGFNITCYTLGLTQKQRISDLSGQSSLVYILLYRQQVSGSGDPLFYLVSTEPFPVANENTLLDEKIVISDILTDAGLTDGTHRVLNTNTSELPHNAPETFTHCITHKNRVVGIGADQRTIWDSSTYVDSVMPSFNDTVTTTVDDTNEVLIALGSLYDKLLIFTRTGVWVRYGDGPSAAGTGNDWSQPQRLPVAAGCIDPRSVVNTPLGVMYQSVRGLELVSADLGVQFLGKRVAGTTKTFPICTSAVFCEDSSTVRFTFTSSEAAPNSGNGAIVLYDIRRDRWAVHSVMCGMTRGNVPNAPMQGAAWHPVLGYCATHNDSSAAALIYRENTVADPTPWLDFGTYFVPLQVQMAWIKSGDLVGWQKVRRVRPLTQYFDAHGLSCQFDYDYNAGAEVHSFTSAQVAVFANPATGFEMVKFIPKSGRCSAIGVTLTTVAPTSPQVLGSGRGAGFTGVALEIHQEKGGYRRLPAAAKG